MASSLTKGAVQKITISLPQTLAEKLKAQITPRQRSTLIAKILEEYLAIAEQIETLDETAGSWTEERHPDMATDEDIDTWLATLRGGWQRQQSSN